MRAFLVIKIFELKKFSIFSARLVKQAILRLRPQGAVPFSDQTARRRLRNAGIRARRPVKRLRLQHHHRLARLHWATAHRWTAQEWRNVMFSDESRYRKFHADGRVKVFRRRGEELEANTILDTEAYGGGSVMVWAGISIGRRTDLIFWMDQ